MSERAFNGDVMIPVICEHCWTPYRLADAEMHIIERALAVSLGNRSQAAKILGIHVRTLRRKLNGGGR